MASVLLENDKLLCSSDALESSWIPISSPSFHGSKSVINFENVHGGETIDMSFFQPLDKEETCDEDYDGYFHHPSKKRRLTIDQVKFLEKSFEVENKLEPDRKVQLAKQLGLQPRQVAIWFQNRRARFKTKQLEKDYDVLKSSYDKLKAEYENLLMEESKLKDQVLSLQQKLKMREKGQQDLELHSGMKSLIDESSKNPILKVVPENVGNVPKLLVCKQEDASSASSDVCDLESPHYIDRKHFSVLEPAESSDFSQDEDDKLSKNIFPTSCFMKLEDECYHDLNGSSYNFAFPVDDVDQPFNFWPY